VSIELSEQDVRERAYQLWEARGRPEGGAIEDWLNAEGQLKAELDAVSSPLEPLARDAADVLEEDAGAPIARPRSDSAERGEEGRRYVVDISGSRH
jgi:hypothetical protein